MWSARLKTYASPAGSSPAGSSTGKTAGRKPPLIAGTGLRIRFRVRKKDLLSSCSPSACSRPSDSTPHPCCKPVKHTKGSRNRNAGNRNRKRRKSAGYVKSNISCCSMSINRNSWKGNGLRARCSLRLPKRDGFEIHIRTKGVLGSRVKQLDKSGSITYSRPRGSRSPDFSGCHKAISAYLKFLETVALS